MDAATIIGLYSLALALRLVPLTFSVLPFNIDGFPLAGIAQGIGSSGHWALDEADVNAYNLKLPVYSLLWSAFSQLAGLDPLFDLQWSQVLVTATVVLPVYLLGLKTTGSRGVGFVAGLLVTALGTFLFLTSAVMKESLGLVLLPATILAFHQRADPRRRAIAFLLLLVLVFLHHLTALMALGTASALIVMDHRRALARGTFSWRRLGLDVASGPGAAVPAWAYYSAVSMPFFRDLTSAGELVLFLGVVVLLTAFLVRMWRPVRVRLGRPVVSPRSHVLIVPLLAAGGVLLNLQSSVFAGVLGTQTGVAPVLGGFAVLGTFAVLGYSLVRRTMNHANNLVLAILVAPTALVLFAFLRGLDPLSHTLVYRAFDFMDFAFAIVAGVGFVVVWNRLRSRSPRVGLAILFVAGLLLTTPAAWNTQAVFGVENVTTAEEFNALAVLTSLGAQNVTTDQRLANVAEWWFGIEGDASLPVKIRDNASIQGIRYALVLERWATVGAQLHPAPNVRIDAATLDRFIASNRVVYVTGAPGDRIFVLGLP